MELVSITRYYEASSRKHINFHFMFISREAKKRGLFSISSLFPLKKLLLLLMLLLLYHIFSLNAHGLFFFCCYERIACNFPASIKSTVHVKWYTLHCFTSLCLVELKMRRLNIHAYLTNIYAVLFYNFYFLALYALLTHIWLRFSKHPRQAKYFVLKSSSGFNWMLSSCCFNRTIFFAQRKQSKIK